ncbi:MAG: hypothetical protein K0R96_2525 [Pantoea agglomerans]|jgi:uncharacterized paraquat-inducible protein A|nr:hypothetical protein [Pantoea agglomerans]
MDTGIVHKGYPRIKKSCVMNSQCPLFAHSGPLQESNCPLCARSGHQVLHLSINTWAEISAAALYYIPASGCAEARDGDLLKQVRAGYDG